MFGADCDWSSTTFTGRRRPNRVSNQSGDRLGLTSLAYLWQKEQHELLKEMIDSGVEAILVKVAAMGLEVD